MTGDDHAIRKACAMQGSTGWFSKVDPPALV